MRLIRELGCANTGAVVGCQTVENTLNNGHTPFVFGDFLLVRQFHAIHADQATVMNCPGRQPLRRRHNIVELWLAEVGPKRFYAPGQLLD